MTMTGLFIFQSLTMPLPPSPNLRVVAGKKHFWHAVVLALIDEHLASRIMRVLKRFLLFRSMSQMAIKRFFPERLKRDGARQEPCDRGDDREGGYFPVSEDVRPDGNFLRLEDSLYPLVNAFVAAAYHNKLVVSF